MISTDLRRQKCQRHKCCDCQIA